MKQKILIISGIIVLFIISLIYFYPRFTQPSKQTEFGDAVITLERTECYGKCPAYKLTIFGDGRVVYDGKKFVNITGKQTTQLSQNKIKKLVDKFYEIGYFTLKDKYDDTVTDMSTTITSITIDDKTKKVVNYYNAPKKLEDLETKIDEITNSKKWVEGK